MTERAPVSVMMTRFSTWPPPSPPRLRLIYIAQEPQVFQLIACHSHGKFHKVIYDAYTGSAACVGVASPCGAGNNTNSYLALVPFEDPDRVSTSDQTGPDTTNSRVACVSCHRAHGSSSPDGGRWDFNVTALEEGYIAVTPLHSDLTDHVSLADLRERRWPKMPQ